MDINAVNLVMLSVVMVSYLAFLVYCILNNLFKGKKH